MLKSYGGVSMRRWFRVILLCLTVITLPEWILAQGQLGAVTGSIFDASGAVVPQAQITITNTDTGVNWKVKGSSAGYYRVPVPPGNYQVEASMAGFKTAIAKNVVVSVTEVVTVDLDAASGRTNAVGHSDHGSTAANTLLGGSIDHHHPARVSNSSRDHQ